MIVSGRTIAPEPVQDILMSLEMTNETKKRLDTLQGWAKDLKVLLVERIIIQNLLKKNSKSVLLLLDFFILTSSLFKFAFASFLRDDIFIRKFICTDFCSYI